MDFDWEHLSHEDLSEHSRSQQRHVLGKVMAALRKALNSHSKLSGKIIVSTTRHNAYRYPPPQGSVSFRRRRNRQEQSKVKGYGQMTRDILTSCVTTRPRGLVGPGN